MVYPMKQTANGIWPVKQKVGLVFFGFLLAGRCSKVCGNSLLWYLMVCGTHLICGINLSSIGVLVTTEGVHDTPKYDSRIYTQTK